MDTELMERPILQTTLLIEPNLWTRTKELAHRSHTSAGWIVREALREFLRRHESTAGSLVRKQ